MTLTQLCACLTASCQHNGLAQVSVADHFWFRLTTVMQRLGSRSATGGAVFEKYSRLQELLYLSCCEYCPRAASSAKVVACTYHHWCSFSSKHRRYCQLDVSGRHTQRFLQFRVRSCQLPVVIGRFAGAYMLPELIMHTLWSCRCCR